MLSVFAFCIVVVFGILAMARVPFEPFVIYSYNVKPGTACPLEPLDTFIDSELEKPLFGSLGTIDVETSWVSKDGRAAPVADHKVKIEPYGRMTVKSPVLRFAPRDMGTWAIEASYVPHGKVLGVRRSDLLERRSDYILRVLDGDSPECKEN